MENGLTMPPACPAKLWTSLLDRDQFRCRFPRLLARHVFYILDGSWCVVLFLIGLADGTLQPLAAHMNRPNRDLVITDKNASIRVFQERPIPAARLQAPRAHKDASLHDHRPDADDTMRFSPGPDAEYFILTDVPQNFVCETFLQFHLFMQITSSLHSPTR